MARHPLKRSLLAVHLPLAAVLAFCSDSGAEGISPELAKSVQGLVKQLNEGARGEVQEAYDRLLKIGAPAAPIVLKGYAAANLTGRGMILQFFSAVKYEEAVGLLIERMEKEEEGLLRGTAARAALRTAPEDKAVLEKVTEAARTDPDGYVRLVIVNSLGEVLSRASIPYVISLLKDEVPPETQRIACQALRRCTRQRLKSAFEPWNDWWIKNQDLFAGCKERTTAP